MQPRGAGRLVTEWLLVLVVCSLCSWGITIQGVALVRVSLDTWWVGGVVQERP